METKITWIQIIQITTIVTQTMIAVVRMGKVISLTVAKATQSLRFAESNSKAMTGATNTMKTSCPRACTIMTMTKKSVTVTKITTLKTNTKVKKKNEHNTLKQNLLRFIILIKNIH